MNHDNEKLGFRRWMSIVLIGLVGQIAWAIENNYINLWVYSQSHNADHVQWMTVASAIMATLTTFFIGALSDKLGKRKFFITTGYTVWGVSVFAFGLMSLKNMTSLAGGDTAKGLLLVGIMNVVVDCVMTFFGSTANDACFNAFVTDTTNTKNRPFVESVLSIMPLVGMAAMLGVGMCFGVPNNHLNSNDAANLWFYFFLVFGILTTLVGIASFFLLPKDEIAPNREQGYLKHMLIGFTPKKVKANPLFYIALIAFLFFNIGVDSFMPYIMIYMENLACLPEGGFMIAIGSIMGVASLVVIVVGLLMEKIGKMKVIIPSVIIMGAGALGLFLIQNNFGLIIVFGILLMVGYLVGTAALGAEIRDQTPENDVGAYQSVRMVFAVMLPMVIGSSISGAVFQSTYTTDYGEGLIITSPKPDQYMFLVTLGACLLSLLPVVWLIIAKKKISKAN